MRHPHSPGSGKFARGTELSHLCSDRVATAEMKGAAPGPRNGEWEDNAAQANCRLEWGTCFQRDGGPIWSLLNKQAVGPECGMMGGGRRSAGLLPQNSKRAGRASGCALLAWVMLSSRS